MKHNKIKWGGDVTAEGDVVLDRWPEGLVRLMAASVLTGLSVSHYVHASVSLEVHCEVLLKRFC